MFKYQHPLLPILPPWVTVFPFQDGLIPMVYNKSETHCFIFWGTKHPFPFSMTPVLCWSVISMERLYNHHTYYNQTPGIIFVIRFIALSMERHYKHCILTPNTIHPSRIIPAPMYPLFLPIAIILEMASAV